MLVLLRFMKHRKSRATEKKSDSRIREAPPQRAVWPIESDFYFVNKFSTAHIKSIRRIGKRSTIIEKIMSSQE